MNKSLYRIVFNQSRGQLMAVAETAGAQGKSASGETTCSNSLSSRERAGVRASPLLSTLSFCIALSLGITLTAPLHVQAQIKADPAAPRAQQPVILQTASGVPQVDIASPSAAGVSRNTFSQFDVNRQGVILNNSRVNALTQLGGYVAGNPMLAAGSARVILNEINSANPSFINGYVEVAGQRAEVIIANPSGINVNGGGFINASRATLTTGTPIMNGGSLDGYLVQRGNINISGAGLDTSTTDYTGILARAVQVNAGIWAKELKVVAGANQINEAQTTATPTAGTGPAPGFAIDVAQLGGMYAGKITLVGSEAGVGVRNAGVIGATAGDVAISSSGWLSNAGTVYAAGNTSLAAQGNITNAATGLIAAQGNTSLAASGPGAQVITQAGSVLAAGLNADGSLATSGDLSLTSTAQAQLKGQFAAGGGIALTSASLDLADITLSAQSATLKATTGDVDLSRSTVNTAGTLAASAARTLRTDGATVTASQLNITANEMSNVAGQIIQTGAGNASISLAGELNNTRGRIATNAQNLTLAAHTLRNTDGKLEHAGTGALGITANIVNGQRGQIISNGALVMNGGAIILDNASTTASQITVNAASLSNRQGTISQTGAGQTGITASQGLDNTSGKIQSNGAVAVNTTALNNASGVIASAQAANITATAGLNNEAGTIETNAALGISTTALRNVQGRITSMQDASIAASAGLDNTSGKIQSNGAVAVNTTALNNISGVIASAQNANITAIAGLNNTTGTIETNGTLGITTTALRNAQGRITSMQDASIAASAGLDNTAGAIESNASLAITAQSLTNQGGSVQALGAAPAGTSNTNAGNTNAGNVTITSQGGIDNSASGRITSGGDVRLAANELNNSAGFVLAAGKLNAAVQQAINNTGGQMAANGNVQLTASNLNNTRGVLAAVQGNLQTTTTGQTSNDSGTMQAALDTTVTANGINNTAGKVTGSNVTLTASTGGINNSQGLVSATNSATVQDSAANKTLAITNTDGSFIAGRLVKVDAASLTGDGKVQSLGDVSVALTSDFNNQSEVLANHNLTLNTTGNVANSGKLQAGNALTVSAANISNAATGEIAGGSTTVTAASSLTNRGLIDGQTTRINAPTLTNIGTGRIYGDDLSIASVNLTNDAEAANGVTTAAFIAARNRMDIGATNLSNISGATLLSVGDMFIGGALDANGQATGRANVISNHGATIQAMGNMYIAAQTINNTNAGYTYEIQTIAAPGDTVYSTAGGVFYASVIGDQGAMAFHRSAGARATFWMNGYLGYAAGYAAYNVTSYTATTQKAVLTSTKPSVMSSGGVMALDASSALNNDMSQILAGTTLSIAGAGINNVQISAPITNVQSGSTYTWGNFQTGRCGRVQFRCHRWSAYAQNGYYSAVASTTTLQGNYQSYAATPGQSTATPAGTNAPTVTGPAASAALAAITSGPQNTGQPNTAPTGQVNAPTATPVTMAAVQVRTSPPGAVKVPNSALYRINTNPANTFVVQTDPRFTGLRQWLSSDYMLAALNTNPSNILKRLGDGFYEQRLINEQVAQLTGRRFLGNYQSDDQQYKALMSNAITYAKQFNLRPGIALSAAQMAQLTSDIVWLVEQTVTLPDGSTTRALVPQLYVTNIRPGDMDGTGALLSAQAVRINVTGDVNNSGSIGGNIGNRTLVSINANNINNLQGRIQASAVGLTAERDITNTGGNITAGSQLVINAGRDINLTSTTASNKGSGGAFTRTMVDRLAGVYVVGLDNTPGSLPGSLILAAGRNINAQAAAIANTSANGQTLVQAGNNINLTTITTDQSISTGGGANYFRGKSSQDVGTSITSNGNLTLSAGNNINALAANLQSSQGTTNLLAAGSINLLEGRRTSDMAWGSESKTSGFLSSSTTTRRETGSTSQAVATNVGGVNVNVVASKDITVKGSSVVADKDATLSAGGNITIEAATNTQTQTSFTQKKESGFLSGGGFGITIGKREQSTEQKSQASTAAASTVGAIKGNVTVIAGNQYKQVGSDVLAPGGDITVLAKDISITEARNTSSSTTEQKFKQTGLTLSISSPVISALQTIDSAAQAAGKTSDGRSKALATATGVLAAKNAIDAIALNPAQGSSPSLNISLGTSKSQSNTTSQSNTAQSSTMAAGGDVRLIATGAGQASNLLIQGSDVKAGNNILLAADNQVNLLAAKNESSQSSTSSSSSGAVGMSLGADGWKVTASASGAKGSKDGQHTGYTNTQVTAGNTLVIQSGGDTNLIGATAAGRAVIADIGGNLNIQSLQDTSTFTAKDRSIGVSIGIPIGPGAASGSINASKTDINSNFKSVTTQSGIKAGDGGFDIVVAGNTDLKGGVIASTQQAINDNKNSLITGSLTASDLQNQASYKASQTSLGVSFTGEQKDASGNTVMKDGKPVQPGYNGFNASPPIPLSAKGTASSTTVSGISGGQILITDDKAQSARTGQSAAQVVASINRTVTSDVDTSNALKPIFNEQEIRDRFAVTGALMQEVGIFLVNRGKEADAIKAQRDEALRTGDEAAARQLNTKLADAEKWGPNGGYRIALTAFTGALTGNVMGSSSQIVQSVVINTIQALGAQEIGRFADSLGSESARGVLQGLLACAGAAAQNASCGAGALGAGAGVLINILLKDNTSLSATQKEARRNLVTSLVAALASSTGSVSTAVTAVAIETENNALSLRGSGRLMNTLRRCEGSDAACSIDALRADMQRDTKAQNQRITEACSGASASLSTCMNLANSANQSAMNLLNATIYADTPAKRQLLQELITAQVSDMEALNKLVDGNVANASGWDVTKAGLAGTFQMLTMAGVRVKEASNKANPTDVNNGFLVVPGRVQSRINLQTGSKADGVGWGHVVAEHFSGKPNKSQFTISEAELRSMLGSDLGVKTPVTRSLDSQDGIRYVREINAGRTIGIDKFSGQPTNVFTVLTDRAGNLVTATPGTIK